MKSLKKIIEIINDVIRESVADKYLQSKHGIEPEFSQFEKQYQASQLQNNVIYQEQNWKLLKNPNSLQNIDDNVRGVILTNGDLYLESVSGYKIHNDILKILADKGIIPVLPKKNWTSKLPQETGFLTVQRYKSSPYLSIGESNKLLYEPDNYNNYINNYDIILNKAKSKNPNIQFMNKLVGSKYLKSSNSSNTMNESYLKFNH